MLSIDSIEQAWAKNTASRFEHKLRIVRERSAKKIPNRAVNGVHNNKIIEGVPDKADGICWWTNGFWAGMLWQAYHVTHDERYADIARYSERCLDEAFNVYLGLHHDVGFMWLLSAIADYRLTNDTDARRRGLKAAQLLAGRFNPTGYIRAWNELSEPNIDTRGWAIIDCMLNIPLLYWASEEIDDPRFAKIAMIHADTVAANFIREDGSVRHIVEFDPNTGAFIRDYAGQGYAQGSSWTRGQSWALYGFIMSYKHTGAVRYLAIAEKVSEYFVAHIPVDGRIPVDFLQPAVPAYYDDIAAAVAACGLIELATLVPEKQDDYLMPALKMLHALDDTVDWDDQHDGYLQYCSADYHGKEHNVNFTYGDYYFYEALLKLTNEEIFLW